MTTGTDKPLPVDALDEMIAADYKAKSEAGYEEFARCVEQNAQWERDFARKKRELAEAYQRMLDETGATALALWVVVKANGLLLRLEAAVKNFGRI